MSGTWFVDGRRIAKARRMRCAVESMLAELPLSGSQLVSAELARSAADLVDSARSAQDSRLWLQASTRLEKMRCIIQPHEARARPRMRMRRRGSDLRRAGASRGGRLW